MNSSRIRQRLAARALYGIKVGDEWRLPAFQFRDDGLVPGIEQVLPHLPENRNPVAMYRWFHLSQPDLHDGDGKDLSPIEWLELRFRTYYGPEFTGKAMFFWSQRTGVTLHFIQPGKPTQNAFVESFNGKFRAYCLDLHWFADLFDARTRIENWRQHYNHVRSHRSLGKKPPAMFAREVA